MAPCPLEPRSAAAEVGADGRVTAWLSTQTPHQDRFGLAGTLGVDPGQIRVVAPDVGGGFGAKMLGVEEILVVWLARRLGRAARWTESRSESMVALGHGRAQEVRYTLGGTRDGKVLAYRLEVLQDSGAYPALGAFLPHLTHLMASGVYAIPKIEFSSVSVVTNTTPTTAFRGAGRPEATQTIERALDAFASEIGMDPAEVRRVNFIDGEFPHKTASGATYDSGDYAGALDLALRAADYDELRAEQTRRREDGGAKQLGIGVSSYVEVTNGIAETEFGDVEITPDGGAIVRTGSFSHGQGHETTFAMIAAERLGLPIEKVTVVKGDTDDIPKGTGTYGSKSTQIGGMAAALAAETVVEQAKSLAADYLEASADDVVLDDVHGRFHVVGAPEPAISWAELASRAAGDGRLAELKAEHEFQGIPTFPFGAHVAVVEVDTDTGAVELLKLVAVDDAGTLINPLLAEGQVHGGVATGVGQALFEAVALRRRRQSAHRHVHGLRVPVRRRAAVLRGGRDGDADAGERARRQGDRRVGDDRLDARRPRRGARCACAARRDARRHARERRERLAGAARGSVTPPVVALLGLGEAGSRLAADLEAAGADVRGYDPDGEAGADLPGRASEPETAVAGADVVLSVNSATGRARGSVGRAAGAARRGPLRRPEHRAAGAEARAGGARRARRASRTSRCSAPFRRAGSARRRSRPEPERTRSPTRSGRSGMPVEVVSDTPGDAATLKLLRSVFMKGLAAAAIESLRRGRGRRPRGVAARRDRRGDRRAVPRPPARGQPAARGAAGRRDGGARRRCSSSSGSSRGSPLPPRPSSPTSGRRTPGERHGAQRPRPHARRGRVRPARARRPRRADSADRRRHPRRGASPSSASPASRSSRTTRRPPSARRSSPASSRESRRSGR